MSDDLPGRNSRARAKADAQAAATRRRWITLGELLAVVAVCISALTLWNSWTERNESVALKNADARQASTRAVTLVLVATSSGDRKLTLKPAASTQSVQGQTILFPRALGVAPAQTAGNARIEAAWFEHALKNARSLAHLPDDSRSDERLPVAIITRFLSDDQPHEDVALYDIGYGIAGHWFTGHSVTLRGIALVSHVKGGNAQARVDARWNALTRRK